MASDCKSFLVNGLKICVMLVVIIYSAEATIEKRSDDVSLQALETLVQQQGATIQQQGAMIQQQGVVIQDLQAKLSASENKLTTQLNNVTNKLERTSKAVAFTVRFSNSPDNIGDHGVFKFDTILTNLGQGYDKQTGIFTASVPGLYVFFLNLMSSNSQGAITAAIDKHGQALGIVWAGGQPDPDDQGSNLVTTHLNAGDQVWVRHNGGSTAIQGGVWTIFSGSLIQAD